MCVFCFVSWIFICATEMRAEFDPKSVIAPCSKLRGMESKCSDVAEMWLTASWESTKPWKDLIRWGNKLHSIGVREEFKSHKDYQKYKRRSELEGCAGCALFFRPEEIKSCWKSNVGKCKTLFRDREIWEVWWAACFLTMVHKHGCRYWKRFACYKGLISVPALFMNQKLLSS